MRIYNNRDLTKKGDGQEGEGGPETRRPRERKEAPV